MAVEQREIRRVETCALNYLLKGFCVSVFINNIGIIIVCLYYRVIVRIE